MSVRRRWLLLLLLALSFAAFARPASARTFSVAVVRDGPAVEPDLAGQIEKELGRILETGRTAELREEQRFTGAWEPASIARALDNALSDPSVDAVLVTGVLGLQAAVELGERLAKPVVSSVVLGSALWGLPKDDAPRVGHPNLVYLVSPNLKQHEVDSLLELVPYRRLDVAIGASYAAGVRTLRERTSRYGRDLDLDVRITPLGPDRRDWDSAFSDSVEVVLLGPAPELTRAQRADFIESLLQRGIPAFSLVGHADVELGALAALTPDPARQVARRVALNLYEIAGGVPPEELPVTLRIPTRMLVNGESAARLGRELAPRVRMAAEVLHPEALDRGVRVLSLASAMRQAEVGSAQLQVSDAQLDSAVQEVGQARSPLLPQIAADGSYLDADPRGLGGLIPDRQTTVGIEVRQMIYDDRRVSDFRATGRLRDSAERSREVVRLDVVADAGRRFLGYVLARILVRIQDENVRLTEDNLALARRRLEVGYSGRDEVFRWEAVLAQEQSRMLAEEAREASARISLNQALGLPQGELWVPEEIEIDPQEFPFLGGAIADLFRDPRLWMRFEDFAVAFALENAPEVEGLDYAIEARGIQLGERKRSFFVPRLDLSYRYNRWLQREPEFQGSSDDFYAFEVAARLPLFEGGLRVYDVRRNRAELRTLEREQGLAAQIVEQRARTAVRRVTNSFPVIGLQESAAESSARNLAIVRDRYVQGIVNVTDLLDAQNQSIVAKQAAAAAIYEHVADLIDLQRGFSWFQAEATPEEQQALIVRIRAATRPSPPVTPTGEE